MSHWTNIQTQIKDIAALDAAVKELGLALVKNATARGYASNQLKGDYVIRLKGPYDIAVNLNKQGFKSDVTHGGVVAELGFSAKRAVAGAYSLSTDWFNPTEGGYENGPVEKVVGKNFGKLLQLYGVHKTMIEARKKGHLVQRKAQKDGSIKLTIGGV